MSKKTKLQKHIESCELKKHFERLDELERKRTELLRTANDPANFRKKNEYLRQAEDTLDLINDLKQNRK